MRGSEDVWHMGHTKMWNILEDSHFQYFWESENLKWDFLSFLYIPQLIFNRDNSWMFKTGRTVARNQTKAYGWSIITSHNVHTYSHTVNLALLVWNICLRWMEPNGTVNWLEFLLLILEFPGLNFVSETDYQTGFPSISCLSSQYFKFGHILSNPLHINHPVIRLYMLFVWATKVRR